MSDEYQIFIEEMNAYNQELRYMEDAMAAMKRAYGFFKEQKREELYSILSTTIAVLVETQNRQALDNIYWNAVPGVTSDFLDVYKKVTGSRFVANPVVSGYKCKVCGQDLLVTSKNAIKELSSEWSQICGECKVEKEEQRMADRQKEIKEKIESGGGFSPIELRSMEYSEYLRTDHWKAKRQIALKRENWTCQACGEQGGELHVHHITYEHRGYEHDEDLMVLCAECHKEVHEGINNG